MANITAQEVLTGSNATVFVDGEEILTFTNIEITVTPNYEDVQIGFDVDRTPVSWTGEGTLSHQATNSISARLFNKMKANKDLRVTIEAEMIKPAIVTIILIIACNSVTDRLAPVAPTAVPTIP